MFLALMVDALGSPAPPPRGPAVDISNVDGGCSWISGTASPGGPLLTFLMLMVGVPRSPAPPPRGPAIDIFCVDGGRS
jgi:hypothetical protein